MNSVNKTNRADKDRQLIAGIKKHLGLKATLALTVGKLTGAELVDILQKRVDAAPPVAKARAAWLALARAEQQIMKDSTTVVRDLRQALRLLFGPYPEILADFGLTPWRTPRALNTVERSQKLAKAKATRKARHTVGKRKKLAIKGTAEQGGPQVAGGTQPPSASGSNGIGNP